MVRCPFIFRLFVILLFFGCVTPFSAKANFDFNANCLKAYQFIFELKLKQARQLINAEKRLHPNNAIVPLLENYVDYFYLITTDSKKDFDKLKELKSARLDQISNDDSDSPYCLYGQAEINLQWALLRGRYGEYFGAAREIKKANGQLQENSKKFPGFHLNAKGLGLIHVFLGNLPDGALKKTLATFGIKGDVDTGLAMLDRLASNLPKSSFAPFYDEVIFYYAFVLSDLVHAPDAYQKTMKFTSRIPDSSLLKSYLQAYVSVRNDHSEEAIAILNHRPTGDAYQPFAYLELLMGTARLNKLDYTARNHFNKFLATNKGVNYIKDANLHLAWIALLNGDTGAYNGFVAKVKSQGYSYHDKDKQALSETESPAPDLSLLKARLLTDGGYFSMALATLANRREDSFTSAKDKVEFAYRLGKINSALGKDQTALQHYQQAINSGKDLKYYYAATAALNMGQIYASRKIYSKAKLYYTIAINMKNHEYESSIEARAKDGLKRLGKL